MSDSTNNSEQEGVSKWSFKIWWAITWPIAVTTVVLGALFGIVLLFITSIGEDKSYSDYLDWAKNGAFYLGVVGVWIGTSDWKDLAEESFESFDEFQVYYRANHDCSNDKLNVDDDADGDFDM